MFDKLLQPKKAVLCIFVTLEGILMVCKFLHLKKAYSPISFVGGSILIEVSKLQSQKALYPMISVSYVEVAWQNGGNLNNFLNRQQKGTRI